ncbi:MAG: hypothetical protein WKF81_08950 [Thermomicrobiales bacterium]
MQRLRAIDIAVRLLINITKPAMRFLEGTVLEKTKSMRSPWRVPM